jgi:hypothetical protein
MKERRKGVKFKTMYCKSAVGKENFHSGALKKFSVSRKLYINNIICMNYPLVIRSLDSFVNMCLDFTKILATYQPSYH